MDKIFINGKIHTFDKDRRIVSALGIKGEYIDKLGSDEELLKCKQENSLVYDLGGKTLIPGFNDSHIHLLNCGIVSKLVDLKGTNSIEDIIERLSDKLKTNTIGKEEWLLARGWNQDYFLGKKDFPSRYDLDRASKEVPIIVTRACGHVAVVNSKVLEILGITGESPQPEGGQFDLDERGEATGVFRENAIDLLYDKMPSPDISQIKKMMVDIIEEMNRAGITSVGSDDFQALSDKNYDKVMEAYSQLLEENRLNIRVNQQCLLPELNKLEEFIDKGYKTGDGNKYYRVGPLKLLIDGSLGARTAALRAPYSDDPSTRGITTMTQEELDKIVNLAHNNGIQVAIHAIGDRAMDMALDSIEKALKKKPKKDHRHGIVHCQITDEEILNRFADLDTLAYIQPIFLDYDWKIVRDRVGKEREKTSYNWKTMLEKKISLACGSDAPVEPFNVIKGIYQAVARKDMEGRPQEGWLPEQALSVEEVIYGFTMGGAYSSFEEDIKGSIEEGKLADLVVLSQDIFTLNKESIRDIEVDLTLLGGKVVFCNNNVIIM